MPGREPGEVFVAQLEKWSASLWDCFFPGVYVQFQPLCLKKRGELSCGAKCGERLWLLRQPLLREKSCRAAEKRMEEQESAVRQEMEKG